VTKSLLALAISCGLLLMMAAGTARAEPETERLSQLNAAIGGGVSSWSGRTWSQSSADRTPRAAAVTGVQAETRADAAPVPETAAETAEPRKPIPLGGPSSPTPFGLSLFGLVGVGVWMQRRRRRMAWPLI